MIVRFSPEQVAKGYCVTKTTVIGWCESGVMPAVNVAGESAKRKRWRMSAEDLAIFDQRRQNKVSAAKEPKSSRRTIQRPTKDFFATTGSKK